MAIDDENRNIAKPASTRKSSGESVKKSWLSYLPPELKALINKWRQGPKHALCRHRYSCTASITEVSEIWGIEEMVYGPKVIVFVYVVSIELFEFAQ